MLNTHERSSLGGAGPNGARYHKRVACLVAFTCVSVFVVTLCSSNFVKVNTCLCVHVCVPLSDPPGAHASSEASFFLILCDSGLGELKGGADQGRAALTCACHRCCCSLNLACSSWIFACSSSSCSSVLPSESCVPRTQGKCSE
jgi:hypothetical protein